MSKAKWIALLGCFCAVIFVWLLFDSARANHVESAPISAKVCHSKTDNCFLNMSAQEGAGGYDLAFVYVNSLRMDLMSLVQYTQDGEVSDHRIYTSFRFANTENNDSTVIAYATNYKGYGTLDGTIALGQEHAPLFDGTAICENCKSAILSVCPEYDVFLIDLREHVIYDICKYNYEYTFRNYQLQTSRNQDGTITISIVDSNLQRLKDGGAR